MDVAQDFIYVYYFTLRSPYTYIIFCNNSTIIQIKATLEENNSQTIAHTPFLNGIKLRVFFKENIEKRDLCRHDKNYYYLLLQIKYSCD